MATKVEKMAGLAPLVHFESEKSLQNQTPIKIIGVKEENASLIDQNDPERNETEYYWHEKDKKKPKTPSTSGVEDDSSSSNSFSNYSMSSLEETVKKNDVGGSHCEVKFALDEKDSIMSSSSSSSSSDSSDDEDDRRKVTTLTKKPKIPDGAWGWMVVLASFILSMIADGISFSFGLLYIEFLHEFSESKSKTAWIGSLFMAVPLLSGPIMSALVDRYGCRKMTIAGGLISATGFIISSKVQSIEVMFFTFGVLAGLGLGLCYVTAVVCIAYWFDKKRNLALGLGAAGTGIGTFVYAPMTQFFIDEYRWRGATLLLAGTFLNMCICGCLMRDPDWLKEEESRGSTSKIKSGSSYSSVSGKSGAISESNFPGVTEIKEMLKGHGPEYVLTTLATSIIHEENDSPKEECRSVVNIPTFIKQNEKVPLEVLESLSSNKKMYNVILENYPSLLLCRSTSDKGLNEITEEVIHKIPVTMSMKIKKAILPRKEESNNNDQVSTSLIATPIKSVLKKTSPLSKNDTLHQVKKNWGKTNYFKNIKVHRNSLMYRGAMMNIHRYRLRASSCPNIYKNSMTTLAKEDEERWYTEFLEMIKGMCDLSLFLEFHFFLTSISTILLFIWFIVPYFYLAEHLTRYGYTENDASVLLSIIGIANTVGMVGLGWAGDQPWMHVTKTYAVCLVFCGFSVMAMIYFTENYIMLVISSIMFGLFFASMFSFIPVIIVEQVPLDSFTQAYGLSLLCQGIGNLLGPPIAGLMFDITGHWEMSFYQAGIWIIISGLLIAIIPYTDNRKMIGTGPLQKDLEKQNLP